MQGYVPSRQLRNPPLVYTIAALKVGFTNPEGMLDQVKHAFGKSAYSVHERVTLPSVEIRQDGDVLQANLVTHQHLIMSNSARNTGWVIWGDRIVFHTTSYTHFREFGEDLRDGLAIIASATDCDRFFSAGFRQIDNVRARPDKGWSIMNIVNSDYLAPTLRFEGVGHSSRSTREAIYETDIGILSIRTAHYERAAPAPVPMELAPLWHMLHQAQAESVQGPVAILDFDLQGLYQTEGSRFDAEEIVKAVDECHRYCSMAFRGVLDASIYKAWEDV